MTTFSIIQKSQLEGAERIDAEYFQPDYLSIEQKIRSLSRLTLGDITEVLTDYHANGSYEILKRYGRLRVEPDFALMVRSIDLQTRNFDNDVKYVSEESYNYLRKTKLYGNELIIDKIGNAGEVYLMPELHRPVTLGMNLLLLRLKDGFDPKFIYVYLNSKFGKLSIYRRVTGTTPLSIDKDSVRSVPIPSFPISKQKNIAELVDLSSTAEEGSKNLYKQAEELLLGELGLKDFKVEDSLSYVVNFSDEQNADRIDAEYFQPKYEKLIAQIKSHNAKTLEELVLMIKGFEPGAEAYQEEGKLFIRVSSLSKFGIETIDQKYLSDDLYNKLKNGFEPKEGEILLTKDATPGIAYVLDEPIDGIISGGILRLKLKTEIEPEYLALCINSMIGKWQVERDAGGSIII